MSAPTEVVAPPSGGGEGCVPVVERAAPAADGLAAGEGADDVLVEKCIDRSDLLARGHCGQYRLSDAVRRLVHQPCIGDGIVSHPAIPAQAAGGHGPDVDIGMVGSHVHVDDPGFLEPERRRTIELRMLRNDRADVGVASGRVTTQREPSNGGNLTRVQIDVCQFTKPSSLQEACSLAREQSEHRYAVRRGRT